MSETSTMTLEMARERLAEISPYEEGYGATWQGDALRTVIVQADEVERLRAENRDLRYVVDAARHDHAETRRMVVVSMEHGFSGRAATDKLVERLAFYDDGERPPGAMELSLSEIGQLRAEVTRLKSLLGDA